MGWNLSPIKCCHPECSLTVTAKPPGKAECKQLLKLHRQDCMEIHPLTCTLSTHHPCQHTSNALLLVWLRQCQCPSLAELRVQGGKCRAAFLLVTALPTSCFPSAGVSKGAGSLLCGVPLLHHPHQAQMSARHKGLALLILIFSSSSLCIIHGNHSKCTVPSPDPTEVSGGAPVDPSGAGL